MWIVILITKPIRNDFQADFFPRKVAYKKDALELVKEIESKGGTVRIEKARK